MTGKSGKCDSEGEDKGTEILPAKFVERFMRILR
jgi:hypothetical protein